MDEVQKKIETIVEDYKKLFWKEYELGIKAVQQTKDMQANKFGEMNGTDYINRALFEIPETLDNMLNKGLTIEENTYRKTKECARWFANKYKEFSLTYV